jgi:alpha-ketoglutarate-dependent taurine dioxygenase
LYSRNILLIKNISPTLITDKAFAVLGKKFGRVWTHMDYKNIFCYNNSSYNTGLGKGSDIAVAYMQSNNTPWGKGELVYHADIPLPEEYAYPGRAIYMANTPIDGSGITSWLNLEYAWEQCTEEEKERYRDIVIVMHNICTKTRLREKYSFLKINPKTGKSSPRLAGTTLGTFTAWIHHIEKDNKVLSEMGTRNLVQDIIVLLESKQNTVYNHTWINGDLIIFNNWFGLHKRSPINEDPNNLRQLRQISFDL